MHVCIMYAYACMHLSGFVHTRALQIPGHSRLFQAPCAQNSKPFQGRRKVGGGANWAKSVCVGGGGGFDRSQDLFGVGVRILEKGYFCHRFPIAVNS